MKINRADFEVLARFDFFGAVAQHVRAFARFVRRTIAMLADIRLARLAGDVNRAVQTLQQHAQAARMIAMLMRDDNAVKL